LVALNEQKLVDRFGKASLEYMLVGFVGQQSATRLWKRFRQVESINGCQEKMSSNAMVQVAGITPKAIQLASRIEEVSGIETRT
jgi:hypothetical protein